MRWSSPLIAHRRRGPRSGHNITASRRRLRRPRRHPSSISLITLRGDLMLDGSKLLKPGIRPWPPNCIGPGDNYPTRRAAHGAELVQAQGGVPEGEGRDPRGPRGEESPPTGGALRRCTNEAVRAMRPSQLNSRSRLAEAQCFLQHSGQTLAEQFPALVRVLLPALRGPALHGQMVRDECELTCISRPKPFPALVRIGVMDGPSRKLIPAHVNQYVAGIRSPATAGPRRTLVPRRASPTVGRGLGVLHPSSSAGWPRGPGTIVDGDRWYVVSGWWYRLGCRIPTYLWGARGREPPSEEILEQCISQ